MLRSPRNRLFARARTGLAQFQTKQRLSFVTQAPFQVDEQDILASKRADAPDQARPTSATWFLPAFSHAYAGIHTALRIAAHFAEGGIRNHFVIYDRVGGDTTALRRIQADITLHFPTLAPSTFTAFDFASGDVSTLASTDIGVCTLWDSAYLLLRFNQCHRKFYLAQDYEPSFSPAGAKFALAESTYRFGFDTIANTPGLLNLLTQRHGVRGMSFIPAIDGELFHPPQRSKPSERGGPVKIVCYARPGSLRNAFELLVAVIRDLSERDLGRSIEIVTAGADWSPRRFGVASMVTNVGLLHSLPEVADLYRDCDIGVVYMLSAHPSYQPFEYMACGVATVTNLNDHNAWFLRDGQNCLTAEPSAKSVASRVATLVQDPRLRAKLQTAGLETVSTEWQPVLESILTYVAGTT